MLNVTAKGLRFIKRRVFPLKTNFWEYSGRIEFATQFLRKEASPQSKILDVGGAPGDNLLKKQGIQNVTVLDLNPKSDIVGTASSIPLQDSSVDFVTCLDTFEHIPTQDRAKSLNELIRVAKKAVVLVAPQNTDANLRAEALVLKYVDDPFLHEHKQFGLLDTEDVEAQLQDLQNRNIIKSFQKSQIDNLLLWVCLMTEDHVNSSAIYQEARFLEDAFYPRRAAYIIWKFERITQ